MKRVLHCIPSFRPGGAERQLAMLTHLLPEQGWEVHVAFLDGGQFEAAIDPATVLHRIPHRGNYDARIFFRLARLIRRLRPDLVHTWLPQMDVFGGAAATACGTPWVMSERSSAAGYPRGFQRGLRVLLGRRAKGIVANSNGGLNLWKSNGRGLLRRIPNAVAYADAAVQPPGIALPKAAKLVVYVGRLAPGKGLPALIDAMKEVRRELDAAALLCGEGPLAAELQARIDAAGLRDAVVLAGFVPDVRGVLGAADAFVSASEFEGHPNAVLEAVTAGVPLVVSDIGAHREFLGDDCARFAPCGDPAAIAAAIVETLRDAEAARARAARARTRSAEWEPASVGAAYDAYYREVLEGR